MIDWIDVLTLVDSQAYIEDRCVARVCDYSVVLSHDHTPIVTAWKPCTHHNASSIKAIRGTFVLLSF